MCGDVKEIPTRPPSPTINEAQKYCRARVERRWLVSFKQAKEYEERKTQRHSVTELVEDILQKKKAQRSEHAWKVGFVVKFTFTELYHTFSILISTFLRGFNFACFFSQYFVWV